MALDPQVKALLDMLAAAGGPPLEQMEVPAAREMYLAMRPPTAGAAVAKVEDRRIPGGGAGVEIPVRIYTPEGGDGPFPIVVYFHGGGWVIGDLETHDHWCRALASGVPRGRGRRRLPAGSGDAVPGRGGGLLRGDALGGGEREVAAWRCRLAWRSRATARVET